MANKAIDQEIFARIPVPHWEALVSVVEGLEADPPVWVLTGSMAFALQGLPLIPKDLDLQTDAQGAHEIEKRFVAYTTRPVEYVVSERIRSHYGAFVLNGIAVEIMGDVQKRLTDASWTSIPDLAELRRLVTIAGFEIPVLPLTYEAEAYAQMGRPVRAQELLSWIGG